MSKIELGKQYSTRDGRAVKIFSVLPENDNSDYTVFGMMKLIGDRWIAAMWTAEGKFDVSDLDSYSNLVLIYETFEMDAPVMAWNTVDDSTYAHFAGIDPDGLPMVWADGRTSHSTRGELKRVSYMYAVKC